MTWMIGFMMFGAGLLGMLLFLDVVVPNFLLFCQAASDNYETSLEGHLWYFLAFLLLIGISWFLSRKSQNMGTINGCGDKLFGRTSSDHGYLATKWICIFFLAVLPVASYEVLEADKWETHYVINRLDELLWTQILGTFAKSFLILIACLTIPVLLFNLNCFPGLLP
jgi:hypothetical protein